ncbi:MAG: hypothetical protein DRQ62_09015 [Gammaproteobacteria bacterium]|nr:MAG: hypothetical protein DRQ62_09015 [Gammaproteobacteria bacterium]
MLVFFRNIPAQTKRSDLIEHVESAIKAPWFRKKGSIESVKVIHLKDHHAKASEYHCVMTIEPEVAARRVIKRLNKSVFLGRHIIVREYQRRIWQNDPRINYKLDDLEIINKRMADRRRKNLEVVKDVSTEFSGNKAFHREHN